MKKSIIYNILNIAIMVIGIVYIYNAALLFNELLTLLTSILQQAVLNGMSDEFKLIFVSIALYFTIQVIALIAEWIFKSLELLKEKKNVRT